MFKTIITRKKSFFFHLNNITNVNKDKCLTNIQICFFGRKEINKSLLLNNLHKVLSNNPSFINEEKNIDREINKTNPIDYKNVFSLFRNSQKIVIKNFSGEKFYEKIFKQLKDENVDMNYLEKSFILLDKKYQVKELEHSTSFRFLVLLDQILNKNDVDFYKNEYGTSFLIAAFGHLNNIFEENFYALNCSNEIILKNNFLYFMLLNKGDFSDILQKISENSVNFENKLKNILSFKIKIVENSNNIDYNMFHFYEQNNRVAPSEVLNDYSFKYRTTIAKEQLYNKLVLEKQNIQKMTFLLNEQNKFKEGKQVNLEEIQKLISLYLLQNSKEIFNDEFLKLQKELDSLEAFISEISLKFTNLKICEYNKIKMNNIEDIFNPLFSGEYNLQNQFSKIQNFLGYSNTDKIFLLYCEKIKTSKTINLKDLFNLSEISFTESKSLKNLYFNHSYYSIQSNYESFHQNYNPLGQKKSVAFIDIEDQILTEIGDDLNLINKQVPQKIRKKEIQYKDNFPNEKEKKRRMPRIMEDIHIYKEDGNIDNKAQKVYKKEDKIKDKLTQKDEIDNIYEEIRDDYNSNEFNDLNGLDKDTSAKMKLQSDNSRRDIVFKTESKNFEVNLKEKKDKFEKKNKNNQPDSIIIEKKEEPQINKPLLKNWKEIKEQMVKEKLKNLPKNQEKNIAQTTHMKSQFEPFVNGKINIQSNISQKNFEEKKKLEKKSENKSKYDSKTDLPEKKMEQDKLNKKITEENVEVKMKKGMISEEIVNKEDLKNLSKEGSAKKTVKNEEKSEKINVIEKLEVNDKKQETLEKTEKVNKPERKKKLENENNLKEKVHKNPKVNKEEIIHKEKVEGKIVAKHQEEKQEKIFVELVLEDKTAEKLKDLEFQDEKKIEEKFVEKHKEEKINTDKIEEKLFEKPKEVKVETDIIEEKFVKKLKEEKVETDKIEEKLFEKPKEVKVETDIIEEKFVKKLKEEKVETDKIQEKLPEIPKEVKLENNIIEEKFIKKPKEGKVETDNIEEKFTKKPKQGKVETDNIEEKFIKKPKEVKVETDNIEEKFIKKSQEEKLDHQKFEPKMEEKLPDKPKEEDIKPQIKEEIKNELETSGEKIINVPEQQKKLDVSSDEKQEEKSESVGKGENETKTNNLSMEEKFKRQKQNKFYFNNKKEFSTLIKFSNKSFSIAESIDDEIEESTINNVKVKSQEKSNSKNKPRTENKTEDKKLKTRQTLITKEFYEEKNKNKPKTIKYLEEIKNSSQIKMTKKPLFYFKPMLKPSSLEDNSEARKLVDVEDITIMNYLEFDDKIVNNYLNHLNGEIIVESNLESSEFGVEYWINIHNKLKNQTDIKNNITLHFIEFFKKNRNNNDKINNFIGGLNSSVVANIFKTVNFGKIFFDLFVESVNLFEFNLGRTGYFILLRNLVENENRRVFEKILYHMNKFNFVPNDNNFSLILEICNKYNYPLLLKNITDDFVINKNMLLSAENFIKYIQILSMFMETNEYVLNLIDASYSDFKIPIRAEFYEMLILRCIMKRDLNSINSFIENLQKRYLVDYPSEILRNTEIYRGNSVLIKTFNEILESKNFHLEMGLKSDDLDIVYDNKINIFKEMFIPHINNMIKQSRQLNKDFANDGNFVNTSVRFYLETRNYQELKAFFEELSRANIKDKKFFVHLMNLVFREIVKKISKEELIEEKKTIDYINFLLYILKNKTSSIDSFNKVDLLKPFILKKFTNFLSNSLNKENKILFKELLTNLINVQIIKYVSSTDQDLRRLMRLVFENENKIDQFFDLIMIEEYKYKERELKI